MWNYKNGKQISVKIKIWEANNRGGITKPNVELY